MSESKLMSLATGRTHNLFEQDLRAHREGLLSQIEGRRLLVIGGAGSIGSATVRELIPYKPGTLHVIDQNENQLAELVRDIRSQDYDFRVEDFLALAIDFGSPIMHRLIRERPPYDLIMNFAAIKHVRSEKNVLSILQMFDTNILKPARFLSWIAEKGEICRIFFVSTDKAADPANLMGASKRMMEHVLFSSRAANEMNGILTSARFANVAFSDGSLLSSWHYRLEKKQPIPVPRNTKRYFISAAESATLCLLASTCLPNRHILMPLLDPQKDLRDLSEIAMAFIKHSGYEPCLFDSEEEAKRSAAALISQRRYPVLLTPLDTNGEKDYEIFLGENEKMLDLGFSALRAIPYVPLSSGNVEEVIHFLGDIYDRIDRHVSKEEIIASLSKILPEFRHLERGKNLDDRL
jgi:FlaA1/EpsC-like NDP-sugar epimerase